MLAPLDLYPRSFQRRQEAVKVFAVRKSGINDMLQLLPHSGWLLAQPCAVAAPAGLRIFNDRQPVFPAQQVGNFSDSERGTPEIIELPGAIQ